MHLESERMDVLIVAASFKVFPADCVFDVRSIPARSQKLSLFTKKKTQNHNFGLINFKIKKKTH